MSLGNRNAKRHDTALSRTAGVNPEDFWDFKPGQTVMTVDGFLGKVTGVNDGPFSGSEEYIVTLANGMGGGSYTASQLKAATDHSASIGENTAARDYPELAQVLQERHDPGKYPSSTLGMVASLQTEAAECTERRCFAYQTVHPEGHQHWIIGSSKEAAAYYTEAELREIGQAEEQRQGKSAEEILSQQASLVTEAAYSMISEAGRDEDLRFQITSSWIDVRKKAQRLRAEGRVKVTYAERGYVVASVRGDHGEYESVLLKYPGTQKVGQWDCSCAWAKYNWNPDFNGKHAGRMCSHCLALNYEAQTKGLIGRDDRITSHSSLDGSEITPLQAIARYLVASGEDRDEVALLISAVSRTAAVNSPFGEPAPNIPSPLPGPTMPKDPNANPASSGFLTAPDPTSWSQSQIPGLDRMAGLGTGTPLHDVGDLVQNFRGDGPFVVRDVRQSPGRGRSHKVSVSEPDDTSDNWRYGTQYNEDVFSPHPDAPPEQHQRFEMRKANNKAADDLLHEIAPEYTERTDESGRRFLDFGPIQHEGSLDDALFEPEMPHTAAEGAGEESEEDGPDQPSPPNPPSQDEEGDSQDEDDDEEDEPEEKEEPSYAPGLTFGEMVDPAAETARQNVEQRMHATLHDEPEGALPFTDGELDDGLDNDASGLSVSASAVSTGVGYMVPGDDSSIGESVAPGMGLKDTDDDELSPENTSMMTVGSVADIVARFQATAGAQSLATGGSRDSSEIAQMAMQTLLEQQGKTAALTPAQQQELINEGEGVRARNLDALQIEGTHYAPLEEALSKADDDDEGWLS